MRGYCETCRSCGSEVEVFLDLGDMPVAARLLTEAELSAPEQRHPLELTFCRECALVQLSETVDPSLIYDATYPHSAPWSQSAQRHARLDVEHLIDTRSMNGASQVIEIGSNTGQLLKLYADNGVRVLGIEPAAGPAATARESGIETMEAFFDEDLAHTLVAERRKADIIHAAHVLDHVHDLAGFAAGIAALLKDGGIAFIEIGSICTMLDRGAFDAIHHGRIAYLSLTALDPILRRNELYINDATVLEGSGSLKLQVQRFDSRKAGVRSVLQAEKAAAVSAPATYKRFAADVRSACEALGRTVAEHTASGARVAAYGTSETAATLLNCAGLGADTVAYVCDRNPGTHGRYIPGRHQRVVAPTQLVADRPQFALLMPSLKVEDVAKWEAGYREAGGRFIVPLPEPRIV